MSQNRPYFIRCASCRAKNRIPADKVGQTAKCGKCGSPVPSDALLTDTPVTVTDADFSVKVLNAPLPVLLDCWAPWCGPCQMIGPIMEQLASEWKGRVRVCKLNSDENPQTSATFQIMSIPTMLIFDNGQLMDTLTGAVPKQQIIQKMAPYL